MKDLARVAPRAKQKHFFNCSPLGDDRGNDNDATVADIATAAFSCCWWWSTATASATTTTDDDEHFSGAVSSTLLRFRFTFAFHCS